MEQELVKEVNSIKKWIAAGVILILLSTASMVGISIYSFSFMDDLEEKCCDSEPWDDQAYDAIDEGKYETAVSLAGKRFTTHPNDADIFYIKAQVAFYQGDKESAKMYLLHTKALAPSWDAEYIKPFQEAIEEDAFNQQLKAGETPVRDAASGAP